MTDRDPVTRADKAKAWTLILIFPVCLLVLAAISMWNGHGDLW